MTPVEIAAERFKEALTAYLNGERGLGVTHPTMQGVVDALKDALGPQDTYGFLEDLACAYEVVTGYDW